VVREGILIVDWRELVPVDETVELELILKSGDPGTELFHFFVAVGAVRCAFAVKKLSVTKVADFGSQCVAKFNDTANIAYHCTVQSTVAQMEVIGVINRNNHLLRTVALTPGDMLSFGQLLSFVVFTADETSETVEPWRSSLMGKCSIALLFKIPNVSLPLQKNLTIDDRAPPYRLSLSMASRSTVPIGTKLPCVVRLDGDHPDGFVLYVEPLAFRFLDISSASRSESYAGCRWTGLTRQRISKESNYRAEFWFIAYGGGIFELPGFKVSEDPTFTNSSQQWLSQTIQIIPV
jgi:hypothetical protein